MDQPLESAMAHVFPSEWMDPQVAGYTVFDPFRRPWNYLIHICALCVCEVKLCYVELIGFCINCLESHNEETKTLCVVVSLLNLVDNVCSVGHLVPNDEHHAAYLSQNTTNHTFMHQIFKTNILFQGSFSILLNILYITKIYIVIK